MAAGERSDELLFRHPDDVRRLQDEHLRETVRLCYEAHPFYSKLMRRQGLRPSDIITVNDLLKLPITTKAQFLADPEAFRLRAKQVPLASRTLWAVAYTTGTTSGEPAPIYDTGSDRYAFMQNVITRRDLIDLRYGDVLACMFPLAPFPMGAYSRAQSEAAAVGASVFYTHTGSVDGRGFHRSLDDAVRMVADHQATVLWGVAGFIRRAVMRAKELDLEWPSVRMAMITGEQTSTAMQNDLARRLSEIGASKARIVNRYGATEQGVSMVECTPGGGFHDLAPDQVYFEITDQTGNRLRDGEIGWLTITHLIRRGTVLLRYAGGDTASIDRRVCPDCGRTSLRLAHSIGRAGNIVKIKGTMVNLDALRQRLEAVSEIDEFQIVVRASSGLDDAPFDQLVIRVAVHVEDIFTLEQLSRETQALTYVTPSLEVVDRDDIYNPSLNTKPRRIVIDRPKKPL